MRAGQRRRRHGHAGVGFLRALAVRPQTLKLYRAAHERIVAFGKLRAVFPQGYPHDPLRSSRAQILCTRASTPMGAYAPRSSAPTGPRCDARMMLA